jgi:Na+/H+-dicarboxylate symporter
MNIVNLGNNLNLPVPELSDVGKLESGSFTFKTFITHVFKSFVEAMANNEILQIVVFAIFLESPQLPLVKKGKSSSGFWIP